MAYFNLREGRFRQSNLHLIRPGRIGNRHYIEEMYEHRHQREFGSVAAMAWRLLRSERGGLPRRRLLRPDAPGRGIAIAPAGTRMADWVRRWIPIARVERGCSALLRGSFSLRRPPRRAAAPVDIDNEHDYDVAARYASGRRRSSSSPSALYGPLRCPRARRLRRGHRERSLSARAGRGGAPRHRPGSDSRARPARRRGRRPGALAERHAENDVAAAGARPERSGCYALLLTPKGRIVAELHDPVARRCLLARDRPSEAAAPLEASSRAYIIADAVRLEDRSRGVRAPGPGRPGRAADDPGEGCSAGPLELPRPTPGADVHARPAGAWSCWPPTAGAARPATSSSCRRSGRRRSGRRAQTRPCARAEGLLEADAQALEILRIEAGIGRGSAPSSTRTCYRPKPA